MSESAPHLDRRTTPSTVKNHAAWLGLCVVCGLLIAPVFDAMPARMKFIGLHSWALAGCVGAVCAGAAQWQGIRSRWRVGGVSVGVTLCSLLLLAHWGFRDLTQATTRRMPLIPIPQNVGSAEDMARSIHVQKQLAQSMLPTFTDFQRRRMNSPTLRKIRPLVLWGGELLIAAIVSFVVSQQVHRRMKNGPDFDSLTPPPTGP